MKITRKQLHETIQHYLFEQAKKSDKNSEREKTFQGMDYSNMSKALADHYKKGPYDTRYKEDITLMPFEDRYSWVEYVDYPSLPGKRSVSSGKKVTYIPPSKIPDDYILPMMQKTPKDYLRRFVGMKDQADGLDRKFVPKLTIQEGFDMLTKKLSSSFAPGTMYQPFPTNPFNKNAVVLPPSFSIFLKFIKDRIEILNKKIKNGDRDGEEVAEVEGFKNYEDFKSMTTSFLKSWKF